MLCCTSRLRLASVHVYARVHTSIYIYIYISNCLRPTRHRAQMCVQSALPLSRIGSRLRGQVFPRRLPALRGHTLSLVGRTLHTKSITKCNQKQNGTPANFENAPDFFLYMFSCLSHCNEKQNGMPDNFEKNDSKINQILHPLAPFWPTSVPFWRPSATILTQLATSVKKIVFFVENTVFYEGVFHNLGFRVGLRSI